MRIAILVVGLLAPWNPNQTSTHKPSCERAATLILEDAADGEDATARLKEGLLAADQCIKDGGGSGGYVLRGQANYALDNKNAAIIDFKEAVRLAPDSVDAHYDLGYTYSEVEK